MKITFSPNLSVATLQRATALAETIENKQAELRALLSGETLAKGKGKVSKCKRTPAQRAAISAGLKAKWAERKNTGQPVTSAPNAS